jgi:hypothetical protein
MRRMMRWRKVRDRDVGLARASSKEQLEHDKWG